jgi:8-oxo-dGTP pyrophosphatase MutT (NUDIX family)
MLFTHWSPESGLNPRWVTPGGGVEGDEDLAVAASRELFEESGLEVPPTSFGQKLRTLEFRQHWKNGGYETGEAHFFHLLIPDEISINKTFWTQDEHRDILDFRWWKLTDLIDSAERVGPPGLLELMAEL